MKCPCSEPGELILNHKMSLLKPQTDTALSRHPCKCSCLRSECREATCKDPVKEVPKLRCLRGATAICQQNVFLGRWSCSSCQANHRKKHLLKMWDEVLLFPEPRPCGAAPTRGQHLSGWSFGENRKQKLIFTLSHSLHTHHPTHQEPAASRYCCTTKSRHFSCD